MNLTAFPSREALMTAAAERIADALQAGIATRGSAVAALSGGATPQEAYFLLSVTGVDWPRVTFALVDERLLQPPHPDSNESTIEWPLGGPLAAGASLIGLYAPNHTAEQAADLAEPAYRNLRFDIALMGMGDDGHTASWFPGATGLDAALDPNNPRSVVSIHAPQAAGSADRITLTRSALRRAERVVLLITGDTKRAKLEAVLAGSDDAPIGLLFQDHAPEVLWAP